MFIIIEIHLLEHVFRKIKSSRIILEDNNELLC